MALIQFSGLASGIDSAALIEATLEQQRNVRIKPLEDKISELQDTNTALEELSSLLENLRSKADVFRTLNGGAISKLALSSNESVITATANNSASPGTHSFTVNQLAANGTQSFDDRYSSQNDAIYSGMNDGAAAADRTVTFTIGTGAEQETVAIELTSGTTLSQLASTFNEQSDKATASVVNVGTSASPSYALVVKSNETGLEEGSISTAVGTAISDTGAGAFNNETLNQATDAEFSLAGVNGTITRSSNTVSDVVEGMTFSLQATGTATITTSVDSDQTAVSVQEFVESLNELIAYIKENDAVISETTEEGTNNIFGPLAKLRLDDNALSSIKGVLSQSNTSLGSSVSILADLGITTKRDGTFEIDNDKLLEAISSESNAVGDLFAQVGNNLASVGGTIDQFVRFNGLIDTTLNSNRDAISRYQKDIAETESRLSSREAQLNGRFARLEAIIGNLQSQQNSLSGILGGLQ